MGLLSFKLQDQRGQAFAPRPPQLEAKLRLDFSFSLLFNVYYFYLFDYLAALGLSCGMRDLVPGSRIEPRPSLSRARSLSPWTPRAVLRLDLLLCLRLVQGGPGQHLRWASRQRAAMPVQW